MKQPEDTKTVELPLVAPKRGKGRPPKEGALSGAERMRQYRERLKAEGKVELTVHVSAEVFARLDEFLKFKDETKDHVVDRALKAFLRKR